MKDKLTQFKITNPKSIKLIVSLRKTPEKEANSNELQ